MSRLISIDVATEVLNRLDILENKMKRIMETDASCDLDAIEAKVEHFEKMLNLNGSNKQMGGSISRDMITNYNSEFPKLKSLKDSRDIKSLKHIENLELDQNKYPKLI